MTSLTPEEMARRAEAIRGWGMPYDSDNLLGKLALTLLRKNPSSSRVVEETPIDSNETTDES